MRVLVVDDEPLSRERIVELLRGRPGVHFVAECASGREAVEAVRAASPEIVFLDVQMPGMSGLDVLQTLGPGAIPAVVFVTAYEEHAVRAFELHALDYLLKPFEDQRFEAAFRRARARVESERLLAEFARRVAALLGDRPDGESAIVASGTAGLAASAAAPSPRRPLERLVVKDAERSKLLSVAEIDWIEAANYYVVVHAGAATFVLSDSLGALERALDDRFIRIHRSTIVNLDRVSEFQRLFHGDFAVLLADGTDLKLSRTYRASVEARLGRPI